jgi:hypothetical protein
MASFLGRNNLALCQMVLRYLPSYRDLEEMMTERGLSLDHATIYRWVQSHAPEIGKRSLPVDFTPTWPFSIYNGSYARSYMCRDCGRN